MRHQRQGWLRLVALPVALLGALVVAPSIAVAGPNTGGSAVIDFTDCNAHVVVAWNALPGKFKSYKTEIWSDHGSLSELGSGPLARSGLLEYWPTYTATTDFSNTFHVVTHVYDGKGVEQDTWAANDFAANCV